MLALQQPKHQTPTISPIDKSLSRNRHRVWFPTHRRAIKEESNVNNRNLFLTAKLLNLQ